MSECEHNHLEIFGYMQAGTAKCNQCKEQIDIAILLNKGNKVLIESYKIKKHKNYEQIGINNRFDILDL